MPEKRLRWCLGPRCSMSRGREPSVTYGAAPGTAARWPCPQTARRPRRPPTTVPATPRWNPAPGRS
eukprot:3778809-Pyramimonas_sp.AAC.1